MWAVVAANPYTVAYGLLMLAVLVSVWRDDELQMVGLMLAFSWVARTTCKIYILPDDRPAALTVPEIAIALMAYFAVIAGRSGALKLVLVVCAANIVSNVGYAYLSLVSEMTRDQRALWQLIGNLCFGAQCLLVGYAGWTARAANRQRRRAAAGRPALASGVHPRADR